MEFQILNLPIDIIGRIFDNLTFSELVELRLVNKQFNSICTTILNYSFLSLKSLLDSLISRAILETQCLTLQKDFKHRSRKISNIYFHHKIYQILKSELNILYAICGRYVQFGVYCFTGGRILDSYKEIMSIDSNLICTTKRPLETCSQLTVRLFFQNQEFMDHFEEIIEPSILQKHLSIVCSGTKVVDLLDSCIASNFHIKTTYCGSKCQISGRYDILTTKYVASPLRLALTKGKADTVVKTLTKYIRNEVRWNNYFYCMDFTYTKRPQQKSWKFSLNNSKGLIVYDNQKAWAEECGETPETVFDKTFSRWTGIPSTTQNISYAIELECSKYCAPMRLAPYIVNASSRKAQPNRSSETSTLTSVLQEISSYYKFNMNLKIILPAPNKQVSVENIVKLCHDNDNCSLSQKIREFPL